MKEELFNLPESLSPRLKWMRKHEVRTKFIEGLKDSDEFDPWVAWIKKDDGTEEILNEHGPFPKSYWICGKGKTEVEAVEDLARLKGAVNWEDPKK